jgi:hypothetical protein
LPQDAEGLVVFTSGKPRQGVYVVAKALAGVTVRSE